MQPQGRKINSLLTSSDPLMVLQAFCLSFFKTFACIFWMNVFLSIDVHESASVL